MAGEILSRYRSLNRRLRARFGAILIILLLLGAAFVAARLDATPAAVGGRARVSDGDSFRLGDDRIRLIGLDAPELDQTCSDANGRDWACGREASRRMAALLAQGPVECAPEGHDRYGRLLASCTVAGTDLGRTMVEEGLAIASGRYWLEERAARSAGRGLWAGSFDSPRAYREQRESAPFWDWIFQVLQ